MLFRVMSYSLHFNHNSKRQSYVVFLVYSGQKNLLLSFLSHIDPVQIILGLVKGNLGWL